MARVLKGKIVSLKMQNTAVVEVERKVTHPLYKKLMKRSNKFKVATSGANLELGQTVDIIETKKISKEKYFKILNKVTTDTKNKKGKKNDTT